MLKLIPRADHTLLALNTLFLLFIALVPYPTAIVAEYLESAGEQRTAMFIFSAMWLMVAIMINLLWWSARRHHLVVRVLDARVLRRITRRYLVGLLLYLLALVLSLVSFEATMVVYVLMLVPTLVYVIVLKVYGNSQWGPLITSYLGLLLLGGAFVAVGMFSSSLARNQIVAGVVGIGILLLLWVLGAASGILGPRLSSVMAYLSLSDHFQNFGQGVIDLKDVVFYLSFTFGALFLTVRIFESARWRA